MNSRAFQDTPYIKKVEDIGVKSVDENQNQLIQIDDAKQGANQKSGINKNK